MDARAHVNETNAKGPRRPGLQHVVALVRSAIYSVVATTYFLVTTTLCAWVMFFPADKMRGFLLWWARGDMWLLRVICGQRVEIRGAENRPTGAALVASKHQSAWETLALIPLLPRGVIILKKELLQIPVYGWYASYYGMIPVDRSGGPSALKQLAIDAKAAIDDGFQIVIFPEGTRQLVGAPPDYKPGAIFLYERLKVPMVPVALNSGLLWPRRRFVRYPGTITVSFLPAIPPGLKRGEAKERLQTAIERETDRLITEERARQTAT
ncbi:MAG: lysophospholipid acyltransferase family protein [Pseudomonadota bacterium]